MTTLRVFNSPPGDALRPYSAAASSANAGAQEIQRESDRGDWKQGRWGGSGPRWGVAASTTVTSSTRGYCGAPSGKAGKMRWRDEGCSGEISARHRLRRWGQWGRRKPVEQVGEGRRRYWLAHGDGSGRRQRWRGGSAVGSVGKTENWGPRTEANYGKIKGSNEKTGSKTQVLNYPFLYFIPIMGGIVHQKRTLTTDTNITILRACKYIQLCMFLNKKLNTPHRS
jgi:hypothetical protein